MRDPSRAVFQAALVVLLCSSIPAKGQEQTPTLLQPRKSSDDPEVSHAALATAPSSVVDGLLKGEPQEVLLLIDDSSLPGLKQLRAARPERDALKAEQAALDERAAELQRMKTEVLAELSAAEVLTIVRDYSHLPMVVVRLRLHESLTALLRRPRIKAIYEERFEDSSLLESLP
jgi:hypothetical protein